MKHIHNGPTLMNYLGHVVLIFKNILFKFDEEEKKKQKDESEKPKENTLGQHLPNAWALPILLMFIHELPIPGIHNETKFITNELDLSVKENFDTLKAFVLKLEQLVDVFSVKQDPYKQHVAD